MGIIASVMCNCYRDGLATPCPYPDHFVYDPARKPTLRRDEDLPEEAPEVFALWLETCCQHPQMNQAVEFIASWKAYRVFDDALHDLGAEQFPLLSEQVSEGIDGLTSPEDAAAMLQELEAFKAQQSNIRQAVLVDSERDELISMGSNVLGGALTLDRVSGYDLGFDSEGFFVRDRWELNRVLFRAMQVEQRLIEPESQLVEYVNRETGESFRCKTPFGLPTTGDDGLPRMALQHFHVDLRPPAESRFAYIIDPLTRVLQAAVETGNPVRWE